MIAYWHRAFFSLFKFAHQLHVCNHVYTWQDCHSLSCLKHVFCCTATRYNTGLLIKLTPKGVVFSFHFCSSLLYL